MKVALKFNVQKDKMPDPMCITESLDLPMSWLISSCLIYIWDKRLQGKQAMLDECMTDLMSKMNLLRDTRWKHYTLHNAAVLVEEMINLHFI